jgi:hypothetical protein
LGAVETFAGVEEPAGAGVEDFEAVEFEFGEDEVAVGVVDFASSVAAPEAVFHVVIETVGHGGAGGDFGEAIGGAFEVLAEDDEFGFLPGLAWAAEVAPEVSALNVEAAANVVVAGGFVGDLGVAGIDEGTTGVGGGATGEEEDGEEQERDEA